MATYSTTVRLLPRWAVALVAAVLLAAACADDSASTEAPEPVDSETAESTTTLPPTTSPPTSTSTPSSTPSSAPDSVGCDDPATCPLAQLADEVGFVFGVASHPDRFEDPIYSEVVTSTFTSLTAENVLKWDALHPEPGVFNFTAADALVAIAETNGMEVKGHTLIWAQNFIDATPDWVEEITDPEELRAVIREHFETVLGHFGDRVDRWDVVNEPLATLGTEIHENHFHRVLGSDYVDEMFRLADEIAPDTRLFLNEATTETFPAKADAFFEFVSGMVERGVPIDGVGLQAHLLNAFPAPGVLEAAMERFTELGLEVAITELDIVAEEGNDRFEVQAQRYAQIVRECLAAGCAEVTVWGLDDGNTWLNSFIPGSDTAPLLFDADLAPKPALDAIRAELIAAS